MKYSQNLRIEGGRVFSYNTHVATIDGGKLLIHGHWSPTTSKHVNYVAKTLGLEKVDAPTEPKAQDDGGSMLKTVAGVAALASIFTTTQRESNDWKARMMKAGLTGRGLIMPDNWDQFSEDEKTTRLNGAISVLK